MTELDYPDDIIKLLEEYLERFGQQAPIFLQPWEWMREALARALKENKPIPDPVLPPGAVI